MKLGIIGGCGIVGSALKHGFIKLDHDVVIHDTKLNTDIRDTLDCELIFICVPTPKNKDGSCDISVVEDVLYNLKLHYHDYNSEARIIIKSTVPPGTTENLAYKYDLSVSHSCEFLREKNSFSDFVENHKILVVGTHNELVYSKMINAHGHYPKHSVMMTPLESELLKYFHNSINSLRISFANEFYDICEKLGANYTKVKNALIHSTSLPDQYLDVNKNMRSWSSICLNKDIPAICKLAKDLELDLPLLYNIETSNNRHERTPFSNTRENYESQPT